MDQKLPPGIDRQGKGLRIRIFQKGKTIYSETIACNPEDASEVRRIKKLRDELVLKFRLGLAVEESDPTEYQPFSIIAQEYLDTHTGKFSTLQGYKNIIEKYWLPVFNNRPCASISKREIKLVLSQANVSPKTRDNILGPLRGILDYAELTPNPASSIKASKKQKKTIDRYSPEERDKILNGLSGEVFAYFAILFGMGLRPGEALGLLRNDFDGETWHIHQQIVRRKEVNSTKTGHRRKVYVPHWVRKAIKQMPPRIDSPYLFVNEIGTFHKSSKKFNKAWRKAHKKKQIRYRVPYCCRHTRAAELLSKGILPPDAAKQMGHSTAVFLNTYSEWIEEYTANQDLSRFEPLKTTEHKRL